MNASVRSSLRSTGSGIDDSNAIPLARGGVVIDSPIGPIQFGAPPETIKDAMASGRPIPTVYVVPIEPFKRDIGPTQGLNVAECEFPCYFNFFVRRRRVNLVVPSAEAEARLRAVFQETLFGPKRPSADVDYHWSVPEDARANLQAESEHFRYFGDTYLDVDKLITFTHFDTKGQTVISEVVDGERRYVRLLRVGNHYVVEELAGPDGPGSHLGIAPDTVELPIPRIEPSNVSSMKVFTPPLFGVTVLGASHGFDPTEATSGYVIWVNRRGLMVDPPTNSTVVLRNNGIPSALIEAVILTHCHADHDAGTFQKILTEGRVTLITTPTIMASFVRKYSALSGLEADFLLRIFEFRPVCIGSHMRIRGAEFDFFYSLHSIPCLGFKASFGGKSLAFSGDHLNDPANVKKLFEKGVVSEARRDELLNFPWDADLILHEAGVPPIHTPLATLSALPEDVRARLLVVHAAAKDVPESSGLKRAKPGVDHTIFMDVDPPISPDVVEALVRRGISPSPCRCRCSPSLCPRPCLPNPRTLCAASTCSAASR